jgi:Flp pilus assembly protein TadG
VTRPPVPSSDHEETSGLRPRNLLAVTGKRDDGSAIVEFTLVSIVLVTLLLALLQLGLALHIHNSLVVAAADGARYGAALDRDPGAGAEETRQFIRRSLADRFADDVRAGTEVSDGRVVVYVEVRATLPVIGWLGPPRGLVVRGHALKEG